MVLNLNHKTKIRLKKCYVFSVLLYGVESWTLTDATMKKLVTNNEVFKRLNKELEVIETAKKRKLRYLRHIMRYHKRYKLLHVLSKVEGR